MDESEARQNAILCLRRLGIELPELEHFRALNWLVRERCPDLLELLRAKQWANVSNKRRIRAEKRVDTMYESIERILNDDLTKNAILRRLEHLLDVHSYR